MTNELFPILSGLLVGGLLGAVAPRLRLLIGVIAAIVLGVAATAVSGEYQIGWEFVLIDVPLVAAFSAVGLVVSRAIRRRAEGT